MTIRIVTDSTCDLPAPIVQKHGITVVPLYIKQGDKSYLDGGGKASQMDFIQYDGTGTEKMRITGVITRAAGKVASIQWTKTVA